MPVVVQGVAGLLMAAYFFVSGMTGIYTEDTVSVVITVDGEKTPAEVTLENKRVKVTYKRKGQDIELWYDRSADLTQTDRKIIDEIIKEINRPGQKVGQKVRDKFTTALKVLLTKPETDVDIDEAFAPFIEQFGEKSAGEYMFMYREKGIYAYKNIITRRYIFIDKEGNFYEYTGDGYRPLKWIYQVFP